MTHASMVHELHDVLHDRYCEIGEGVPARIGFRLLGRGLPQIRDALCRLERAARRSVWGMQPVVRFDPEDPTHELDRRSASRGLDMRQLTSPHGLRVNPLLASLNPKVRVGPTGVQAILVDEVAAVLPGLIDAGGRPTAWLVTERQVVELVHAIWDATWDVSALVAEPGADMLSPRQIEVVRGLVKGIKDATLARRLGVSQRTVAADISHVLDRLGAGARSEAVFILCGGGQ